MSRERRGMAESKSRNGRMNKGAAVAPLHILSSALCLLPVVFVCGCASDDGNAPMAESFYLNPYKDVHSLGRVALLELDNISEYPGISAEMTDALFAAFQKRQFFGLNIIHQTDSEWQLLRQHLESVDGIKQIGEMRATLKCDALLVGTITQYQPYPRMLVGLRLKLLDLSDGDLLWGLEQVWDGSDNSTRKRITHWSSAATLRDDLVVMSSLNFSKFVAYETAETLEQKKTATPAPAGPVRTTWQY
jgi:hypothetical protein